MPSFTANPTFDLALVIAFGIVACTMLAAPFVASPYGRFANDKLGMALDPRLGWFLMELPATLAFWIVYLSSPGRSEPFAIFVAFVWGVHYLNRGFLMPALMRVPKGQKSTFGLLVVVVGWVVTSLHGYLNATWVTSLFPHREGTEWFSDPRFIVGVTLYYGAFFVNLHSDHVLRTLRTKEEVERGERVYRIPRGGLFRFVTNPSYLSELVFWIGFALFTWSPAGLYIFLISAANLVPRAKSTHAWYHERFPDYPPERKILIPFVW